MNTLNHSLIIATFVVGAIVANLLTIQYVARSAWRSSVTGHVLLALFAVFALSYDISVMVLFWPETFTENNGPGIWLRIGLRALIDVVLIAMYVLLVRAQRRGRAGGVGMGDDDGVTPPEGVRQPSNE